MDELQHSTLAALEELTVDAELTQETPLL